MGRSLANRFRERKKYHQSAHVSEDTEWITGRNSMGRLLNLAFRITREWDGSILGMARHVRRKDLLRALRFSHYLESKRPSIVFTNLLTANIAGAFASVITRDCPPVVCVVHSTMVWHRSRYRRLGEWRWMFRRCQHAVTVSEGVADRFEKAIGVSSDRITTIYNPACTPEIARRAVETPDHPWFDDGGPPIVLSAGRFVPAKDYSTLIDAFQRVRATYPSRLVILGEGRMRQDLERQVHVLGLEESVSLPGWVNNPYAFMAKSTLFVLSSRHEGFANVLVEALFCGCPAVSTDCPAGPAEILKDRSLLAPVGDPEALADVMLQAIVRPADKASIKAKAAQFSVDRAIDRYEDLMDRLAPSGGK